LPGKFAFARDTVQAVELHKAKRIGLKSHPTLNEKWLQEQIIKETAVLGLGDVLVRDVERTQPLGGRLDLLLEDPEDDLRYEVEIQLGAVDESHIIRTLEYWDSERRRYPQYDHIAVIVAEQITARFFNVIGLFNGFIPLIAIQLAALEVNGAMTLVSTRVLDVVHLGTEEEDNSEFVTDRDYWERKSTKEMLELVDSLVSATREIDDRLIARYKQRYIGLGIDGIANNFVSFKPRKRFVLLHIKLPQSTETDEALEGSGLQLKTYDNRWSQYRIELTHADLSQNGDFLLGLMRQAYDRRKP
jgi:predicted transport protein